MRERPQLEGSQVETRMFRYEIVLGDRLTSRKEENQAMEVAIK
jgi:hypothetical protein